jgi:hypothetical protein
MRRLIAVTTVLVALGVGASSATAAPPGLFGHAQRLCERQGGSFGTGAGSYSCSRVGQSYTDRELSQADRVCMRTGGPGIVVADLDAPHDRYDCFILT